MASNPSQPTPDSEESQPSLFPPTNHDSSISQDFPSEAPTIAAAGSQPEMEPAEEAEFGERYTLTREVGRGGMGRVWLARDEVFGRDVAIKEHHRLKREAAETESQPSETYMHRDRFLREAMINGRLDHPSIVPVYDIGGREDGSAFYSMKFICGQSLAHTLREIDKAQGDDRSKLAERLKLLDSFIDVCEALAYAHSKGVLHRDLKPDNIMLGSFGETLVVD